MITITAPTLSWLLAESLFPVDCDDMENVTHTPEAIAYGVEAIKQTLDCATLRKTAPIVDPDAINLVSIGDAMTDDDCDLDSLGLGRIGSIEYLIGETRIEVLFVVDIGLNRCVVFEFAKELS